MVMTSRAGKNKGKYRIPSNRRKGWDYSPPGYSFITICTRDKLHWFGEISSEQLIISPVGKIAVQNLQKIPSLNNLILIDAFVIMPNHIHAIIGIVETPQWGVCTEPKRSPSLGMVVNQYKTSCTKQIHRIG